VRLCSTSELPRKTLNILLQTDGRQWVKERRGKMSTICKEGIHILGVTADIWKPSISVLKSKATYVRHEMVCCTERDVRQSINMFSVALMQC
jgi:hypothetical protein